MLSGELPLGGQVPTEHGLCDTYGVSRITARKALEELRAEGLIERTRGRGSFVCRLPQGVRASGARGAARGPFPVNATEIGVIGATESAPGPSEKNDWWWRIVQSMEASLSDAGFHLTVLPVGGENPDVRLFSRIDELKGRLAGLVCPGSPAAEPVLLEIERRSIPWVTINRANRNQTQNFVTADNFTGGVEVGKLFARSGYEPVLVVGLKLENAASNADKFFGFTQGYAGDGRSTAKISYCPVKSLIPSEEDREAITRQLTAPSRPRAVFCIGDILAANVLRICQGLGLSVPEEVAVVGATGLPLAEHTTPPLTVLAQPMQEMGREAAALLLEMIRTGQTSLPGRYVPSPMIGRESCPVSAR